MSHSEEFLLTSSLILNGIWIATYLVRWLGTSRRVGAATLALFGASLLLYNPVYLAYPNSAVGHVTKALASVLMAAGMWCFFEWAKLQPAPWGQGPRRKTRVR